MATTKAARRTSERLFGSVDTITTEAIETYARIIDDETGLPDLLEACERTRKALLTGQPQVVGDNTVYPLDGALVGNALNLLRAALAKAEGK